MVKKLSLRQQKQDFRFRICESKFESAFVCTKALFHKLI
jgi:hypothetical protein